MMEWKMAEAKNKFSELINKALIEGPQKVTRRQDAVVVINESEYKKLKGESQSLNDFLLSGPDFDGLDITRDKSPMRDVDL